MIINSNTPTILYGTAWKEDKTEGLVKLAVEQGFRGIDTANQRKHYFEAGVGAALQKIYDNMEIKRDELFLQTKYTYARGQDHRLPYDTKSNVATQVEQSFNSSLDHLNTNYIDSYVVHGPEFMSGLTDNDWIAWQAMENLQQAGLVKYIGISNISYEQLELLYTYADIKPKFVQNRCFAQMLWDKQVRNFCLDNNIIYQGFSLLTANQKYLQHPVIQSIAKNNNLTIAQLIFSFAVGVGMLPLTGTTSGEHMRLDLEALRYKLNDEQLTIIENIVNL